MPSRQMRGGWPYEKHALLIEPVLRKRPYISVEQCTAVLASPLRREIQPDGRIRFWGRISDPSDGTERFLRVVTLSDGETVHNAFFDRGYRDESS